MNDKIRERFLEISGKKIFTIEAGERGKKSIVFVHGNFASSKWFFPVFELLAGEYHCIAPDLPNFGRSDRLEGFSIKSYADFVIGVIENVGLERVHFVGHSLGGAVVQSIMVSRPDMVKKAALVDPAPPDGLETPEEVYPYLEMYKGNRELLKKAIIGVMPTRPPDSFTELLVDEALMMDSRCFVENARALDAYDFTDELKGNETPVLVFYGKQDTIVTEEMVKKFEAIMPNVILKIYEDCGHSINVEKPVIFTEELVRFLNSE